MTPLRTVEITRYIAPLREGGSLPGLVEADDGFKYVLKFRGAGQGPRALVAELIGGELARHLGLRVPELVLAGLAGTFGQTEPDEEIQDLLMASEGLNLGLHFLSGAITYDPVVTSVDPLLASQVVWLDAFLTNVDRTARNTNLLLWNRELWLIDHGAALYFHHNRTDWETQARSAFPMIRDHVLLPQADRLEEVDTTFRARISPEILHGIVDLIPDAWLVWADATESPVELREMYARFLTLRLQHSDVFIQKARHERAAHL